MPEPLFVGLCACQVRVGRSELSGSVTLFASSTMRSQPCPNRLIRFWLSAFVTAAVVAALVRFVAGGPGKIASAACPPVAGYGEQETAGSGFDVTPEWPRHSPTERLPSPAALLAESSSQINPYSDNWRPCLSSGPKACPGSCRAPRGLRRPGMSSRVPPQRSLQILLCRWVV